MSKKFHRSILTELIRIPYFLVHYFPYTGSYYEPFKVHAVAYSVLGDRR